MEVSKEGLKNSVANLLIMNQLLIENDSSKKALLMQVLSAFGTTPAIEFLKRIRLYFTPFRMNDISLPFGGDFWVLTSSNTTTSNHDDHENGLEIDIRYPLSTVTGDSEFCGDLGTQCENDFVNFYSVDDASQRRADFTSYMNHSIDINILAARNDVTFEQVKIHCDDESNTTFNGDPCPLDLDPGISKRIKHFVEETRSKTSSILSSFGGQIKEIIISSGSHPESEVFDNTRINILRNELIAQAIRLGIDPDFAAESIRDIYNREFQKKALIEGEFPDDRPILNLQSCIDACNLDAMPEKGQNGRGKINYDTTDVHFSHMHFKLNP